MMPPYYSFSKKVSPQSRKERKESISGIGALAGISEYAAIALLLDLGVDQGRRINSLKGDDDGLG
jgi:hypothetical protein